MKKMKKFAFYVLLFCCTMFTSNAQSLSNTVPTHITSDANGTAPSNAVFVNETNTVESSSSAPKPAGKSFKERSLGGKILIILGAIVIGSALMYLGVNVSAG
jgi:hypothetical protein